MVGKYLFLVSSLVPVTLLGQDKVLSDAIESFKGTADEARKANPLLAVGTGEGVASVMKSLTGRRPSGKGPVSIALPKDQLEELERRQKARERSQRLAKAGPVRSAPVVRAPESAIPAVPPIIMQTMLHPLPRPQYNLVTESAVEGIAAGQARTEVLAALGKPSSISAIQGMEEGSLEVLTYHLTPNNTVAVRLRAGIVTSVTRR